MAVALEEELFKDCKIELKNGEFEYLRKVFEDSEVNRILRMQKFKDPDYFRNNCENLVYIAKEVGPEYVKKLIIVTEGYRTDRIEKITEMLRKIGKKEYIEMAIEVLYNYKLDGKTAEEFVTNFATVVMALRDFYSFLKECTVKEIDSFKGIDMKVLLDYQKDIEKT